MPLKRTRAEWMRTLLSLGALLLGLGWSASWALGWWRGRPAPAPFSHGPLASVHSAWENECSACHREHPAQMDGILSVRERWRDFTCDHCHGDAPHQPHAVWPGGLSINQQCGECHQDHAGSGTPLVRRDDKQCTACHDKLQDHASKAVGVPEKITGFATDHPEFRKLKAGESPARRMKFSHSLHMTPGQVYAKDARGAKTLKDLPPEFREEYRKALGDTMQGDDASVRLDCASCHRGDAGRAKGPVPEADRQRLGGLPLERLLPPRADGRHMLPVNFDLHCKACHPLRGTVGEGDDKLTLDFPHRVQPAETNSWLKRELTARAVEARTDRLKPKTLGGRLDERDRAKVIGTLEGHVAGLLEGAERFLYGANGACVKCHDAAPKGIVPPDLPTVWFEKAWFTHTSHRAMKCAECHPGKEARYEPDGRTVVVEKEPPGIRGIRSCQECHAPTGTKLPDDTRAVGGARHDCTTCHRYHDGANPLHGRAATTRDPAKRLSVPDWLRPGKKEGGR